MDFAPFQNRFRTLPFTLALLLVMVLACTNEREAVSRSGTSKHPDIIFILADDLGYGSLSVYGSRTIHTPHLDSIAREGILFTQFYVASPVCSPSRASLLTGMQPWSVNVPTVLRPGKVDHTSGIDSEVPLLPQILKQQRYRSALIGKWHLGYQDTQHPLKLGFDQFSGFLTGHIDYISYQDPNGIYNLTDGGKEVKPEGKHLTTWLTDKAIDYIKSYDAADPYFLMLSYTNPHKPFLLPGEAPLFPHRTRKPDVSPEKYGALVELLDQEIGKLFEVIWEKNPNTLVIFLSDHGAPTGVRGNGALRGGKGTLLEGGIRVPAIVHWPGHIHGSKVVNTPYHVCDLYQSIIKAASCVPYEEAQGIVISAFQNAAPPEASSAPAFRFWSFQDVLAIRKGDLKAVFIPAEGSKKMIDHYLKPEEEQVLQPVTSRYGGHYPILFDLSEDPSESNNKALLEPEITLELYNLIKTQSK
ncbi:sulfatase-like hydrolase/transferase [Phaeodactylibacter sp.]|uniref:sulfatase family protein n=1 Tax=Phaeodactylibacter sp. TaxID=1940289 RepID=UPI0025D7A223|nr:sulfatase-like hydrolase/transferase [Phaeodactylibacter sp.]MCI4650967.1 sulfatase-like hydrolase/transferase [Phaeodactylibacter sp.]MCI5092362.1 sulfatase-like hydrolase/transferase [Phaeodactylibacter sp.]